MKTHGEAPVVEMVVQNADESILEPKWIDPQMTYLTDGGSPQRRLDVPQFSMRGAIAP